MRNKFRNNLTENANAFTAAEKNLVLTGPGVGGYDVDHAGKPVSGKVQTPAQHAAVKKAAAASVAKRQAGKLMKPRVAKPQAKPSLFGF
jgi:hypothetical protein